MILLRIVSVILIAFFAFSCAPKKVVKEEEIKATATVAPLPEQEVLRPELPQKLSETDETVKKSETVQVEKEGEEKQVILNFDNASIETVIATIGELLNINYILTPGITGRVTIQSHKKFPVKDLFHIFQTILEMNGLTAIKDGIFYKIVMIDSAKQQPLSVQTGKEFKLQLDSSFITQVIPLEYVRANDIVNILRGLMPRGVDLIVYEPTNLLIVTAQPGALFKFMKILEALDMPSTERESMRTYVYYVENGEAKKLVEILKDLYAEKKDKKTTSTKTTTTPSPAPRTPAPVPTPVPSQMESFTGDVEGDIIIAAYEDINGIIIKASPRSYLAILEALKKLDVPVKQVLIEVLIAEVTLSDDMTLGLEWLLKSPLHVEGERIRTLSGFGSANTNLSNLTQITGTPFASIIKPEKFSLLLTALANLDKLNVLASPHILAMDNKEASIQIGDEVPIATGLTQQPATATAGTTLVTTGQIQYKTVGTILTVKPHITEKDRVTLEISQEVSQVGKSVQVAGQNFAGFSTRKAKTTAVVQDGHTLVLGGLITESTQKTRAGIPFLSKIPILGYLFSTTTDKFSKTELILMVTPHVVSNQEEADAITKEFKNKVKTIKKRLLKDTPEISEDNGRKKIDEKKQEQITNEVTEKIKPSKDMPEISKDKGVEKTDKKQREQISNEVIEQTKPFSPVKSENKESSNSKKIIDEKPVEKKEIPDVSKNNNVLVVDVKQDTTFIDVIEANGYSLQLDDKEFENFLKELGSLNPEIEDIEMIPKGSKLKLPLKYLIKIENLKKGGE
ncbi:MAG: hypothetical protein HY755_02350 [Nitrospirae bacterium]|nr:hypothetical protein [Nitrospirota bacterium]